MEYTKGERSVFGADDYWLVEVKDKPNRPNVIIGKFRTKEDALLDAAAPLGYELAEFVETVSATWIDDGLLEIGEGDYLKIKELALVFLRKSKYHRTKE